MPDLRRKRASLWLLACAVVTASCATPASSDTPSTTTAEPRPAAVDTGRIVTLNGDLTEILWELGLGDAIVAVDVTTVHPPEALELPVVGVGRFLNAEAVLAQSPTLVIGDTQTSPLDAVEQIRSAGVPVLITEVATTFDQLAEKIANLADALGAEAAGAALNARIAGELEQVLAGADELATSPRVAFVYSRGPDVMLLFGEGMTTQPLIEAAGGVDAGAASGIVGTVPVTAEALVSAAPDVLVTTSEGLAALGGIEGLLSLPGFAETPAGSNERILTYAEGDVLTFGPRIVTTLGELIRDLRTFVPAA